MFTLNSKNTQESSPMINPFLPMSNVHVEGFGDGVGDSFGLFSNGIFKKFTTPLGVFVIKVEDIKTPLNLTKECKFSFERDESIPKLPYSIYKAILKFYNEIFAHIRSEVYSIVFWDKENKEFFIHIPEQTVSFASVSYERDPELFSSDRYIPVFESHSHSSMGAFFSGTDLKDEIASRYFAVFGHVDKLDQHAFVCRVASNGQAKELSVEDIFDLEDLSDDYTVDLEEALGVIHERIDSQPKYQYHSRLSYGDNWYDFYGSYGINHVVDDYEDVVDYKHHTTTTDTYKRSPLTQLYYDLGRITGATYKSYDVSLVQNLGESILTYLESVYGSKGITSDVLMDDLTTGMETSLNYQTISEIS